MIHAVISSKNFFHLSPVNRVPDNRTSTVIPYTFFEIQVNVSVTSKEHLCVCLSNCLQIFKHCNACIYRNGYQGQNTAGAGD